MIGYLDRAWCCSKNCKNACGRKLTEQDHQNAVKWWGNENYPIAIAEFCDDNGERKR